MAKITVSGVYTIRNAVNGRVYVGSSQDVRARWNQHKHQLRNGAHHSIVLQRSWNKHSEAAFVFSVVEVVASHDDLIEREQHWIDVLHAVCPIRGLNRYPTAGGARGSKASAETRALQSAMRRGKKMPPRSVEHRAALSAAKKGQKLSPETRLKFSIIRRGKKLAPRSVEHGAAISAAKKGKMSPEQRAVLRARMKARKKTADELAALRARMIAMNKSRAKGSADSSRQLTLNI